MVETILSTMHHAPEAQEGHTPATAVPSHVSATRALLAARKPHTSPIRAARLSGPLRCSRALQRREHDDQ